jgi:hemolysin activation/secretion protein
MANSAFGQPAPGQASQLPPAPVTQKPIQDMRIERQSQPETEPAGPFLLVKSLHIIGETRFSESELIAVTRFTPGRSLSLGDLRRMAQLITNYYNARGYIVAQAYVPAQDVKDGAVTITVIEGRYGAVNLDNRSPLRSGVARGVLSGLKKGDLVEAAPLERRLLLLSDMPGVQVHSTLSPGGDVGTSDLKVELTPGPKVDGEVEIDNFGNPYTGAYIGGGTINLNEPLGIGDVASVRVLTSGEGMQYVRGSYQAHLGDAIVGAGYAYFHYHLGKQFAVLDAEGRERSASLYASYPVIRSYDNNLFVRFDYDHRTFRDIIGATSTVTDKHADVAAIGFQGDHHDTLLGGGWDAYGLFVSFGNLDIETPLALATDAATARTQGGYTKLSYSVDRLQNISGPLAIYAGVRGQVASKNLDISEKMELGGAHGVRAYPEGEAYGDTGYIATVEGRLTLPAMPDRLPGRVRLFGFVDTGWVRSYKMPWAPGPNSATRSGAGVGIDWSVNNNFMVRSAYAHPLGSTAATSYPSNWGQFWFEIVKFF